MAPPPEAGQQTSIMEEEQEETLPSLQKQKGEEGNNDEILEEAHACSEQQEFEQRWAFQPEEAHESAENTVVCW